MRPEGPMSISMVLSTGFLCLVCKAHISTYEAYHDSKVVNLWPIQLEHFLQLTYVKHSFLLMKFFAL